MNIRYIEVERICERVNTNGQRLLHISNRTFGIDLLWERDQYFGHVHTTARTAYTFMNK